MTLDVFDDTHLSATTRTINQIMEDRSQNVSRNRHDLAHAVYVLAREGGEFDVAEWARMTRKSWGCRFPKVSV